MFKIMDLIKIGLLLLVLIGPVLVVNVEGGGADNPGGERDYQESDGLNWSFVLDIPYNDDSLDLKTSQGVLDFGSQKISGLDYFDESYKPNGGVVEGKNVVFDVYKHVTENAYMLVGRGDWKNEFGDNGYCPVIFGLSGMPWSLVENFARSVEVTPYTYLGNLERDSH
jgi:hypothetical protein